MRKRVHPQPKKKTWDQMIRHEARHLKPGTIIETCGCDVARIISTDGDNLDYESLTVGGRGSCSVFSCGPVRLSEQGIKKRLDLFKEGGKKALIMRYYTEDCRMSVEEATKTFSEWNP